MLHHRYTTILLSLLVGMSLAVAQENEQQQKKQAKERKLIEQKKDDVFEELDKKNLTLRFFNALTGKEIAGGTVSVGDAEYPTDEEGSRGTTR